MSWFEMEGHEEVSNPTLCSEQGSTWLGAGCSRLCLVMRTETAQPLTDTPHLWQKTCCDHFSGLKLRDLT